MTARRVGSASAAKTANSMTRKLLLTRVARHPAGVTCAHTAARDRLGVSTRVEIRVRGPVALEDADRLGLRAYAEPAETVLRGALADRPALHGALTRILDDGLELISVRRLPHVPPR